MSSSYKKLYKRLLSLVLVFVITAASVVVFPKQANADIALTIAAKLGKVAISLVDKVIVVGLDYAADKTGDNTFTKIADFMTLPSGKDSRKIEQMCAEILEKLDTISNDMDAMNKSLENSVAELTARTDRNALQASRKDITNVVSKCDNIITEYNNYMKASGKYADLREQYDRETSESKRASLEAAMKTEAAASSGALREFIKEAQNYSFSGAISAIATVACLNQPKYVYGVGGTAGITCGTQSDRMLGLASNLANDTMAFEHQKYEYLLEQMNQLAYAFQMVATAHSIWADYLDSTGGESQEYALQETLEKVIYAINDVAKQCDSFTKNLMRPYDVDKTVEMNYTLSRQYMNDRFSGLTVHTCDATLTARTTSPKMEFYNVKPINQASPFLILKNGINGPTTDKQMVYFGDAKSFVTTEFSTMDMDFFNLNSTKDDRYIMPFSSSEFNGLIYKPAYNLANSDMKRYLTVQGGLDPNELNSSLIVSPLNKWHEAGIQLNQLCSFHCHYYVTKLTGFNPSTPSKYEIDHKANKYYNEGMLIVLRQAKRLEYRTFFEVMSNVKISINGATQQDTFKPGTQMTAVFNSTHPSMKGLGLKSGETAEILDVLIDPNNFDYLKDNNNTVELNFTVPYQDFRLVAIDEDMANEVYARKGERVVSASNKMSVSAFDGPETMSLMLEKTDSVAEFSDIQDSPAKDDIEFLASYGLVAGTGDGKYSPDLVMTRSMFVTALSRFSGADVSAYRSSNFSDVSTKDSMRPYVEWAYKKGLISGHGDWKFKPDDPVTREQVAVILDIFLKKAGVSTKNADSLKQFSDGEQISEWAKEAISAVCGAGIMSVTDGQINPKGSMTRAEVASAFAAMLRAMGK